MAKKDPNDLSVEELERLLAAKKRTLRQNRIRAFGRSGRAVFHQPPPNREWDVAASGPAPLNGGKLILDRFLLLVEVAALIGFGFVLIQGVRLLQNLNAESASAAFAATPSPTPLIAAVVLPSGHLPPSAPGGAAPNEAEIPESLRPIMQSFLALPLPTRGPEQARILDLTTIDKTGMLVVEGDGWEQLRQGVGHHLGSADPGTAGNVVLSAHDDIFGELFRDLDRLQPGDAAILYTDTRRFVYRVVAIVIVEPTDLSVMAPTGRPTLTLISCYPYMVDTQRIVVTAELTSE
jgi:sortase A